MQRITYTAHGRAYKLRLVRWQGELVSVSVEAPEGSGYVDITGLLSSDKIEDIEREAEAIAQAVTP